MKYFKKIVGERVYLSPICVEDAEIYTSWLNDSDIAEGLGVADKVYNGESERENIKNILKNGQQHFGVVLSDEDRLIGKVEITIEKSSSNSAEIKLFIGKEEDRGKGYGTEAVRLACCYSFDKLNMHSIHVWIPDYNERSINSYKKVGFKEAGKQRESCYLDGKYHDRIIMDLLRDDLNLLF